MKPHGLIILLLAGLTLSARAGEADLRPRFELMREIEGSFSAGERGRLTLAGDVFGQSRNRLADLRIIGADGTQWPYFQHVPQETPIAAKLQPEIRNRSFVDGDEPYLQFDLVVPQTSGTPPVHNRLELTTSGHDFVRRVEVFEKGGGQMATGYVIDFSRQRSARNRIVRYPESDAARLHVRIYSNAQCAGETFQLTAAKLHYRKMTEVKREAVAATELPPPQREALAGAQTWLLDLGHEQRPAEFVRFKVATPSFARSVSAYGRNNDHEAWKWVGGGEIHALQDDEQTEIKIRGRHRFLKLHVFHHDDQPLQIDSIQLEAVPRYLVFEAASDGRSGLFYRAWDLKHPRYDLKGRIDAKAIAQLPISKLAKPAPNTAAQTQPWRKYSKWLGGLAVAAVSLLVVGIITSMVKQQKYEESEHTDS